jgi:hypothetical protein
MMGFPRGITLSVCVKPEFASYLSIKRARSLPIPFTGSARDSRDLDLPFEQKTTAAMRAYLRKTLGVSSSRDRP